MRQEMKFYMNICLRNVVMMRLKGLGLEIIVDHMFSLHEVPRVIPWYQQKKKPTD